MRRHLFGLIAIVSGCSGRDTTAPALRSLPAYVESGTVRITADASSLPVTTTLSLQVVVRDASKNLLTDQPVRFTSSDWRVAAVDSSGLVIGLNPGKVTITATSESRRGEIVLVVVPAPCPLDASGYCNRDKAYVLQLVDDRPLPVKSPFGAGEWDDGVACLLTSAELLLNPDGTFAEGVWHQCANAATVSQTFGGRYARISSSLLVFVEGPLIYRGEIVGDRLQIKFGNGVTFTLKEDRPSTGS